MYLATKHTLAFLQENGTKSLHLKIIVFLAAPGGMVCSEGEGGGQFLRSFTVWWTKIMVRSVAHNIWMIPRRYG